MNFGEDSDIDFATARGRDWPTIRQFNVFLENRVGGLLNVVRRFETHRVPLRRSSHGIRPWHGSCCSPGMPARKARARHRTSMLSAVIVTRAAGWSTIGAGSLRPPERRRGEHPY